MGARKDDFKEFEDSMNTVAEEINQAAIDKCEKAIDLIEKYYDSLIYGNVPLMDLIGSLHDFLEKHNKTE